MTQLFTPNATTLAAASWSGAGFADDAKLVIGEGRDNVVDGLDQNASDVSLFLTRVGFSGNIGDAGDPAIFQANGATPTGFADAGVAHFGSGNFYYKPQASGGTCAQWIQGGSGGSYIEGGTITQLYMIRGDFNASSATVVTNADIDGGRAFFANNATGFTLLICRGGRTTSRRDCAASGEIVVKSGAVLVLDIPDATPTLDITVEKGGRLLILDAKTIASLTAHGVVDLRQSRTPTTITALARGPAAVVYKGDPLLTITAETALFGFFDAGDAISGGLA